MPVSKHDAEEKTRVLDGAVLDAQENASNARAMWDGGPWANTPQGAKNVIDAYAVTINRQAELIAVLRDLVRQAVA